MRRGCDSSRSSPAHGGALAEPPRLRRTWSKRLFGHTILTGRGVLVGLRHRRPRPDGATGVLRPWQECVLRPYMTPTSRAHTEHGLIVIVDQAAGPRG